MAPTPPWRQSGYKALIGVGQSKVALESALVESMIDHNMDGLILIAPRLPREVIRRFATMKPIVIIGHHFSDETTFDTVNADDARGGELAVQALVSRGYRDIGMLTLAERSESDVSTQRKIGYGRAMTAAGLADRIRVTEVGRSEAEQLPALARWLDGDGSPRGGLLLERPYRRAAARHGVRAGAARAGRPCGRGL